MSIIGQSLNTWLKEDCRKFGTGLIYIGDLLKIVSNAISVDDEFTQNMVKVVTKTMLPKALYEQEVAGYISHEEVEKYLNMVKSIDDINPDDFMRFVNAHDLRTLEAVVECQCGKQGPGRLLESTGTNWNIVKLTGEYNLWEGIAPRTGETLYYVTGKSFIGTPIHGYTNKEVAFREAIHQGLIPQNTIIPS